MLPLTWRLSTASRGKTGADRRALWRQLRVRRSDQLSAHPIDLATFVPGQARDLDGNASSIRQIEDKVWESDVEGDAAGQFKRSLELPSVTSREFDQVKHHVTKFIALLGDPASAA